ncbi:MAG: TolC family protein [Pseudomonadota bacterium]|nr:TolC family protein [Pseudomonadota bacterium]
MFRKSALISLSALLLAMPGQTDTLQEALDQAFQTNPALGAQRADVGVAREQLNQARGARAPTVELSGSATFESLDSNQPIAFNTGENKLASAQLRAAHVCTA